jgi:phage terminase large subunit-like protein
MPKGLVDPISSAEVPLYLEELLRRASIAPGIQAYKPHPSQERFHAATHLEKLYIGGNRSGKTVGAVAEDIYWLTGTHPFRTDLPRPPIRGRIVAVDIEDGVKKIVLPELAKWTPQSFLINGSWEDSYDKQSRTLTLNNGSFVELMSYEQDVEKFAGTSRHFVHFDEEPPKDIYDECLMRLVDTNGSYWIAMTPLIEMSWVKSQIYEPWEAGDQSVFVLEVNTEENPYISVEALDRITRGLTEEERAARRAGTFITHTGLVYSGCFSALPYTEGGNVVPDILNHQFKEYVKGWGHFVCMDHGWTNPTVFLFCCFDAEGNVIVYDEIYRNKTSVKDMASIYLAHVETLGVHPIYVVGDPSISQTNAITTTSVQTEYMEHGVGVALGNNDIRGGIVRCQNRFQQKRLFITERCVETLKEIGNYRWDRFASSKIASRRNPKEMPLKKDDHCMDAMRYGIMSRPALEGEDEGRIGNVLNLPIVGVKDMDYELCFTDPERDEHLGIEW